MSVLTCPVCQGPMREVAHDAVVIDTCTQCRGVWLDRGELEKIGAALAQRTGEQRAQQPGQHSGQQVGEAQPTSFLGGMLGGRGDQRPRRDWDDDDDHYRDSHGRPRKSKMRGFMDFFD